MLNNYFIAILFLEKELQIPNKSDDLTFVFTISNGSVYDIVKKSYVTDFETANQSCQAKGGFLAVIDSSVKQEFIEVLIKQHITNFSLPTGSYLLGIFNCRYRYVFIFILSYL